MTLANNLFHLPVVDFISPSPPNAKMFISAGSSEGLNERRPPSAPIALCQKVQKSLNTRRRKVSSTLLAADNARSKGDERFIYIRCFPLTKLFQLRSQFICSSHSRMSKFVKVIWGPPSSIWEADKKEMERRKRCRASPGSSAFRRASFCLICCDSSEFISNSPWPE